jgi:hypothetical protein
MAAANANKQVVRNSLEVEGAFIVFIGPLLKVK